MPSYKFKDAYIYDFYSIAGPLESKGLIKKYDYCLNDYYFGEKTFEMAEVKMQQTVIDKLLFNNDLTDEYIDLIVGGDLLNQIVATTYNSKKYNIPLLGVYSACATFVESLIVGSNFISNKMGHNVIAITSSHNLTAEKQFRYPIEYGGIKYPTNTFTSTGSAGAILSNKGKIKIESATIGKVIDMGIKDANHMGAVMAPAAADTISRHLSDLKRDINYYDLILTGDLGLIGVDILKEYLNKVYNIKLKKHMDSGCEIFSQEQDVNAGASGPVALPLVLFNKVLKSSKYKKILIVGTGSLHNTTLVNQKNSIPAIAHAVSLEVL